MCCDQEHTPEPDGKCVYCGSPTSEGYAVQHCGYSPQECEHCDWRPCDGSC